MKRFFLFLSIAAACLPAAAQVTIPFDVPMPTWKKLVTPINPGQLFREPNLRSDFLVCTAGPEFDSYEWHAQTQIPLDEDESDFSLTTECLLAVISKKNDFFSELEFDSYTSGRFRGYSQSDNLVDADIKPLTVKDLESSSDVICFRGKDENLYVILCRGTEEHFGWAATFYIGRLKEGYVIFPYTCTVETNIGSHHPGILNGKLGDCNLSKFTMKDVEYILKHATYFDDNEYCVMYGYTSANNKTDIGWLISSLLSYQAEESLPPVDDNKIYTQVEENPTYPGGEAALYSKLAQNLRYPRSAAELGIQGRVIVTFVVEKDGSITNPKVTRSPYYGFDEEAIRVVKTLGKMSSPGKINGRAVRSSYSLPVVFRLVSDEK